MEEGALVPSCSKCGRVDLALKKCGRCLQASYCGAACQRAAWKQHKTACKPAVSTAFFGGDTEEVRPDVDEIPKFLTSSMNDFEVMNRLNAAIAASDWRVALECEGHMEELMEGQPHDTCEYILTLFVKANGLRVAAMGSRSKTGFTEFSTKMLALHARRVDLLQKLERFRDAGETMTVCANHLTQLGRQLEAAQHYISARKLGQGDVPLSDPVSRVDSFWS